MYFRKALRAMTGVARGIAQKRGVSEYSKRMGYKPQDVNMEAKVNIPEILFCCGITLYFMYDIHRDRKEHLEVLMQNFDKNQSYYDHEASLGIPPPMDFLLEKLFYFPTGDIDKQHDTMETSIPDMIKK